MVNTYNERLGAFFLLLNTLSLALFTDIDSNNSRIVAGSSCNKTYAEAICTNNNKGLLYCVSNTWNYAECILGYGCVNGKCIILPEEKNNQTQGDQYSVDNNYISRNISLNIDLNNGDQQNSDKKNYETERSLDKSFEYGGTEISSQHGIKLGRIYKDSTGVSTNIKSLKKIINNTKSAAILKRQETNKFVGNNKKLLIPGSLIEDLNPENYDNETPEVENPVFKFEYIREAYNNPDSSGDSNGGVNLNPDQNVDQGNEVIENDDYNYETYEEKENGESYEDVETDKGGEEEESEEEDSEECSRLSYLEITCNLVEEAVGNAGYPCPKTVQSKMFVKSLKMAGIETRVEASMFLAQLVWESDGLKSKEEHLCLKKDCALDYSSSLDIPGQVYYGRGYIQLTHAKNYLEASERIFGDNRLLLNPGQVSEDEWVSWEVSSWYWKYKVHVTPGVTSGMFGASTKAINGILECSGGSKEVPKKRFNMYSKILEVFEPGTIPNEQGCY
ncbi:hypothetical protein BB559_001630 [Furculomyces boomerangus]|uniref:Glycoside hydrolase family 19 catalytic domain-containing protein n=1 Tax=Furculomyces boomerangus TaxID=61424 RepID=A0A2T9Z177_9FUNG|nr:hypothetical protein BB559_001630 [Furculomyces boomerangus]